MNNLDNWYFIYDASGFKKKDVIELTDNYEKLGYKYNQCTELGAGPSLEQIVVWIQNSQTLSDLKSGLLVNLIYDILKISFTWFLSHRYTKKSIPIVEIFTRFKDKNLGVNFKFRIDKKYNRVALENIINQETSYLHSVSDIELTCTNCNNIINSHCLFYFDKEKLNSPICIFCKDKFVKKKKE